MVPGSRFRVQGSGFRVQVGILCLAGWGLCAGAESADREVLRMADRARGNLEGVQWTVTLESHEGDRVSTRSYRVTAKHFDFLAEAVDPPRLRGNRLLMRNGSMWFHKPDLSKPVPISRRQKLSGTAAYGDIAATHYAEDYDITQCSTVALDGVTCRLYDLKGRTRNVTYDRIRYWIAEADHTGRRAEYFTVSGKLMKSAVMAYAHSLKDEFGAEQPFISSMTIRDELFGSDYTLMTFSAPERVDVSERALDLRRLAE